MARLARERLIGSDRLEAFRIRFGDERADYSAAVERYYRDRAPAGWQHEHVSI